MSYWYDGTRYYQCDGHEVYKRLLLTCGDHAAKFSANAPLPAHGHTTCEVTPANSWLRVDSGGHMLGARYRLDPAVEAELRKGIVVSVSHDSFDGDYTYLTIAVNGVWVHEDRRACYDPRPWTACYGRNEAEERFFAEFWAYMKGEYGAQPAQWNEEIDVEMPALPAAVVIAPVPAPVEPAATQPLTGSDRARALLVQAKARREPDPPF